MALQDGIFGFDYARFPGRNDGFARVTRPEDVALQDYRKRLTTDARMVPWIEDQTRTGHPPCVDLRKFALSSSLTPDDVRDLVREVLQLSPFSERVDVYVKQMTPELKIIATIWPVQGQRLSLNILATPNEVVITPIPPN